MTCYSTYITTADINRDLTLGAQGTDVMAMQRALIAVGEDIGRTKDDGKLGPRTIAAWKRFEAQNPNLTQDGIATIEELAILLQYQSKSPSLKTNAAYKRTPITPDKPRIDSTYTTLDRFAPNASAKISTPLNIKSLSSKTVVIDIGHVGYGRDQGAEGILNGQYVTEGQFNSSVVNKIIEKIKAKDKDKKIKIVIVTGHDHAQPSKGKSSKLARIKNLIGRANEADTHNADLFLSIHTDSRPKGCLKGPVVWTANNDNKSNRFAQNLMNETGCRNQHNNFKVLTENQGQRPAVLFELGDINSEARLIDDAYQDALATQIADGIIKTLQG